MITKKVSLKPILGNLFTEITGIGTTYTITEKSRKKGVLEFSNGGKTVIQLNWIEDVTVSANSEEVERQITVPLVGQLYNDTAALGNFVYERITEILSTKETEQKSNWASGPYLKNSFGTATIHRIKGEYNHIPFVCEYNELFGFMDIKSDNHTIAAMVFQNCNPENSRSFNKTKISKNKLFMSGSSSSIGKPKLDNESKTEWYPFFVRENSSPAEKALSIHIITCLFFGMGVM